MKPARTPNLKWQTEAYCETCEAFTPLITEPLSPPLPDDAKNQGYLLGDLQCGNCYSVHTCVRQHAPANSSEEQKRWRPGPFLPITAGRMSSLPRWAREYIHHVQTFIGAPEVQEIFFLRDQNASLIKLVAELKAENRRLRKPTKKAAGKRSR